MRTRILAVLFSLGVAALSFGQDAGQSDLPYYEMPDYPETYTAETVAARMLDGLGFRYYWATEGLREEDLTYRPGDEARSSRETLEHIYSLTEMIVSATRKKPVGQSDATNLSFEDLRKRTLENIAEASAAFRRPDSKASAYKIIYPQGEETVEFPFWHHINGPIADVFWHCGQVVTFRRSSGNPFNSKVSLFMGKVME